VTGPATAAASAAAVRSSRLSCGKVGKAQIFTSAREASGESRVTHFERPNYWIFGQSDFPDGLEKGKAEDYKEIASMMPNEVKKLISGKDLSRDEAISVCLNILRFEHRHQKALVSPPYIITIIPPVGMGEAQRIPYPR